MASIGVFEDSLGVIVVFQGVFFVALRWLARIFDRLLFSANSVDSDVLWQVLR